MFFFRLMFVLRLMLDLELFRLGPRYSWKMSCERRRLPLELLLLPGPLEKLLCELCRELRFVLEELELPLEVTEELEEKALALLAFDLRADLSWALGWKS